MQRQALDANVVTCGRRQQRRLVHIVWQPDKQVQPGMVMCIDPDNPNRLRLSKHAYDTMVAGIVSGAGDVKTGMTLSQVVTSGNSPAVFDGDELKPLVNMLGMTMK